jgi:hypothetical protein
MCARKSAYSRGVVVLLLAVMAVGCGGHDRRPSVVVGVSSDAVDDALFAAIAHASHDALLIVSSYGACHVRSADSRERAYDVGRQFTCLVPFDLPRAHSTAYYRVHVSLPSGCWVAHVTRRIDVRPELYSVHGCGLQAVTGLR